MKNNSAWAAKLPMHGYTYNKMKLSYKYRLYPTAAQIEVLNKNFNFCCFLYNSALQERRHQWKKFGKGVSYSEQCKALPEIKMEFAEQNQTIYAQSLQQVLKRLDAAYANFFRRVKSGANKVGFPRYKPSERYRSLVFPQCDMKVGGVKLLDSNKLKVFGIPGELKVRWHRPFQGRCKQVLIKRQGDKFYLVLSCDAVPLEPLAPTGKTIAIDLGLNSFITTDNGTKFHHPKPYKTSREKLAYLNRSLAAKQRGSKNRKRAKLALARAHEQVENIRNDFLHKVAKQLLVENDTVIIEKLNVKGMLQTKQAPLAPVFAAKPGNIQDASWGRFATLLSYKAERAGKTLLEVDPMNTSKTCSCCGNVKSNLTLQDRTYHCQSCGLAIDRDHNAALNIRRLGESSPFFQNVLGTSLAAAKAVSEAHD